MRSSRRLRAVFAAGFLLAGCAGSVPSAIPTDSSVTTAPVPITTTPTPPATNRPYLLPTPFSPGSPLSAIAEPPVVDPSKTSASVTRDGVRITMVANDVQIAAGKSFWLTTTLENVGRNRLHWITDGCGIPLWVQAELPFAWEVGAIQPYPYLTIKQWLIGVPLPLPPDYLFPIRLETSPEELVGYDGGCADVGTGHDLGPGESVETRYLVEARVAFAARYGSDVLYESWRPPSGPVDLWASLGTWGRGKEDIDAVDREPIVAHLPIEIVDGRDPRLLSPGQVVDVALGSPELVEAVWYHSRVDQLTPTTLSLDETQGSWIVEVTSEGDDGVDRRLTVKVDGIAGTIVDVTQTTVP